MPARAPLCVFSAQTPRGALQTSAGAPVLGRTPPEEAHGRTRRAGVSERAKRKLSEALGRFWGILQGGRLEGRASRRVSTPPRGQPSLTRMMGTEHFA